MDTQEGINIVDPDGNLGSIDPSQLDTYLSKGYRQATPHDVSHYEAQQQYGTPLQTAAGVAEAVGRGALPFGISTGIERAAGVSPEGILGRQEALPEGVEPVAQIAGLGLSALIPYGGAANVYEHAGQAAAKGLGLGVEGAGILNQIGSKAVQGAAEMALMAGGDEASMALANDPNAGVEHAIPNIGLSALLGATGGAAMGVVSPLWKATAGKEIGKVLDLAKLRYGGGAQDAVNDVLVKSGMDVAPEIRGALNSDPAARSAFESLYKSSTGTGEEMRSAVATFKEGINQSVMDAFQKTPEELSELGNLSNYQVGEKIQKQIADKINENYAPIKDTYENVRKSLEKIPLQTGEREELVNKIAMGSIENGFDKAPSSPQFKLIKNAIEDIPEHVVGINDISKYRNNFKYNFSDPAEVQIAKKVIRGALRDTEFAATDRAVGQTMPDLLDSYRAANEQYKGLSQTIEGLDSRFNVPHWEGPSSFVRSLKDMQPEKIAARAINKNDAEFLSHLSQNFPDAAQTVKSYFSDQVFKNAQKGAGDQLFNTKKVLDNFRDQTPEVKDFLMDKMSQERMEALRQVHESMPKDMFKEYKSINGELLGKAPTAIALIAGLTGHGAIPALIAAAGSKLVEKMYSQGREAFNLSLLKYLGSGEQMSSTGFKAMFDHVDSVLKGDAQITKVVKNVFEKGAQEVVSAPDKKDLERLDKRVKQLSADKEPLLNTASDLGHYLPDHAVGAAMVASKALDYLSSISPKAAQGLAFDKENEVTTADKREYYRNLSIAEQPLMVMNHIKSGTLIPSDVKTLSSIYPALYDKMKSKIQSQIIETVHAGETVPYKMRQSMSLFVSEPLDSSFTPQSIQASQSVFMAQKQQSQPQMGKPKRGTANMSKISNQYMTADQSRQSRMSKV